MWENVDGTQLEKGGGVERGERSEQCESEVPNWIILVRTIGTFVDPGAVSDQRDRSFRDKKRMMMIVFIVRRCVES